MVKRRLTADERRLQILDAAARVFGERGYEATRMEDVAEAADVAKGLLYKHFPSKDALFTALLDVAAERFAHQLAASLSVPEPSPERVLERGLQLWLHSASGEGLPFTDPGAHEAYERARDRVREVIADRLTEVEPRAGGEVAWLLAAAIQGAAESAGIAWARRPTTLSPADVAGLLAAFCWEGLGGLRDRIST